jgi:hypothetical protein
MFRASTVLELGGYDEGFLRPSDYDLWSRIRTVSRIDCIPEPLTAWRDSAANMSTVFKREPDDAAIASSAIILKLYWVRSTILKKLSAFMKEDFLRARNDNL